MRNCFWQLLILFLLFPLLSIAQPTTNYWFEGYIYGSVTDNASQRGKFVPVVLALASNPTKYLAISMTDGAGFFSFRGTPIDYKQQYIVTLLYGTKNESYKCLRYDTPPALTDQVESVRVLKLKSPNKFIPGAIDIKLKDGDWIPLNTEHNFVPLLKK